MKLRPTTLTGRLIATTVTLVAVVSLLVGASATLLVSSYLTRQLDDRLSESLDRAAGANGPDFDGGGFGPNDGSYGNGGGSGNGNGPGTLAPTTETPETTAPQTDTASCAPAIPRGQPAGSITAVITDTCSVGIEVTVGGSLRTLNDTEMAALTSIPTDGAPHDVTIGGTRFRAAARTLPSDSSTTVVQAMPTSQTNQVITFLIWGELALSIAGVALAALLGTLIVRKQMRPLRQVAQTARTVGNTDLTTGEVGRIARVPDNLADPGSEVGQVTVALNQMIGHVEEALDERHRSELQLRAFLADASHELRTPVATIKGYAELTRRTGSDAAESMTKVEAEANRMSALVEDMLLLARLDAGRPLESTPVDLSRLVIEIVNDARVVAPHHHWRIEVPEQEVTVIGDDLRLHQAVTNLTNNASRHTPEGTTVTARVLVDPVRIEIHDNGPGITSQLQASIFDRFTRGDSSRTRASGGAGLGMSLVKAIMSAHGGTASVTSSPGDTTFTLTFKNSGPE